jgi:hypothetical protein
MCILAPGCRHAPEHFLTKGKEFAARADWDAALSNYNKGIELNPGFATAYCDRAIVKQHKGDFQGRLPIIIRPFD